MVTAAVVKGRSELGERRKHFWLLPFLFSGPQGGKRDYDLGRQTRAIHGTVESGSPERMGGARVDRGQVQSTTRRPTIFRPSLKTASVISCIGAVARDLSRWVAPPIMYCLITGMDAKHDAMQSDDAYRSMLLRRECMPADAGAAEHSPIMEFSHNDETSLNWLLHPTA